MVRFEHIASLKDTEEDINNSKKESEKWSKEFEGRQVVELKPDGAGSDGQIGGMSPSEQIGKSNKGEEPESETSKRIRAELAAMAKRDGMCSLAWSCCQK